MSDAIFLLGASGFIHSITADTAAARATFGWVAATSLDDGLAGAWQWLSTRA
ncbi:nucleoside-diphosphate-sugar epimerase [Lysobacter niastensis]|uniref:Nucleoside-diphosphate-sugar epimerase n=1 Tax=Lysobacter niastensis TaxID=380629 RepID=A0ABU1WC48_9GAMM|nr:hypothetical protein [Lysobacter niastensis]MDR7135109.1 nucleoside-diphosphate-sugar epimerase [Lysobacter niastensis]